MTRSNLAANIGAASFALLLLLTPAIARAQRGGAHFVASRPSVSVRRGTTMVRSSPVRTSRRGNFGSTNGFFSNGFGYSNFTNLYPGTGLGINGINTISSEPNLGVEAAIDPATQWNLALAERLGRIGGFSSGGFYLLSGGGGYVIPAESAESDQSAQPQQQPQQQPQVIVLQQAPSQQPPSAAQEQPAPAPLPDVGQFTLVLRDGQQIQAVAFTQTKDRIIYITNDGARRSIALADLNKDETMRLNQERGTPLQLSL